MKTTKRLRAIQFFSLFCIVFISGNVGHAQVYIFARQDGNEIHKEINTKDGYCRVVSKVRAADGPWKSILETDTPGFGSVFGVYDRRKNIAPHYFVSFGKATLTDAIVEARQRARDFAGDRTTPFIMLNFENKNTFPFAKALPDKAGVCGNVDKKPIAIATTTKPAPLKKSPAAITPASTTAKLPLAKSLPRRPMPRRTSVSGKPMNTPVAPPLKTASPVATPVEKPVEKPAVKAEVPVVTPKAPESQAFYAYLRATFAGRFGDYIIASTVIYVKKKPGQTESELQTYKQNMEKIFVRNTRVENPRYGDDPLKQVEWVIVPSETENINLEYKLGGDALKVTRFQLTPIYPQWGDNP